MTCPSCGLENPPSAQYCDCGYEFVPGSKPKNAPTTAASVGAWCPKCKAYNPNPQIAKFCGKCGARMSQEASLATIGCIGLIVILLLIIYMFSRDSGSSSSSSKPSGSSSPQTATSPPDTSKDPKHCLELVSQNGSFDDFSTTITGAVKNNCGQKFRYVEITFKLYDNAGAVVGTAMTNQTNLDAGETWKFRAIGLAVGRRFLLDEITARP